MTVEYVALSYVWGRQHADCPPSDDSQPHRGLHMKLANTIEDAMKVTVNPGYDFLWLDKYCISQGTDHTELQAQLAIMDLVYSRACVYDYSCSW